MNRPSQPWVDLFLAVADLLETSDGEWQERDKATVRDAYRALLDGEGAAIYAEAVDGDVIA